MGRWLKSYLHFLRTEPLWWIVPILLLFGAIVAAAWISEREPSFIYPIF